MRISIDHTTRYSYSQPASYGVQELRMTPPDTISQTLLDWRIEADGMENAATYVDMAGNKVHLLTQIDPHETLDIRVSGTVETTNKDGISGVDANGPPPRLFVRETRLTRPGKHVHDIARKLEGRHRDQVALYHALMGELRDRMEFETHATDAVTTAEEALGARRGVCQDFAHAFISACRKLDQPARYVTGYLALDASDRVADAHHAWAEAEVAGIGWVGFDPANGICPDERYVRLACGLDADYAAPIRGIHRGAGVEKLSVQVTAAEQSVQSQSQSGQSASGQTQKQQ